MASVFGFTGLISRLDDWRANRRVIDPAQPRPKAPTMKTFQLVDNNDEDRELSRLVENLVIPKLIANCDGRGSANVLPIGANGTSTNISEADVEQFTRLSVNGDAHELLAFVDQCLSTGRSVESIYVDLLAPAARKLGSYWEEDSQDFVDVTMGLWRIQEILRELTLRIPPAQRFNHGRRSALFSPMPGEQHSLGTLMIGEFFERAGWDADILVEPTQSDLRAKYAVNHYDIIGLTVSCDCSTAQLTSLVTTIRAVSCNPEIRIMVGGRVINEQPDLANICGADGTAIDAPSAVALADLLVPVEVERFAKLA
jgi:MerR family transcriptional regulator, light-induced transcriptional regulator